MAGGCDVLYNRLLVECTELVIGKSTEAKARNNKLKLAQ